MDTNNPPIDKHLAEALAEEEVNRMSHEALKELLLPRSTKNMRSFLSMIS